MTSNRAAPMTDAMNPAPCPSAYQPIICPMNVAAIAPAMPKIAVSQNPEGPVPGVTAFAIRPATKPIRIVQIQCITGHLLECVGRPGSSTHRNHRWRRPLCVGDCCLRPVGADVKRKAAFPGCWCGQPIGSLQWIGRLFRLNVDGQRSVAA